MAKDIFKLLIFFISISLLFKCDNYEFPESPYPRIETLPVVNISESGATFQANIILTGNKPIVDHGFVWGFSENISIDMHDKIQLGKVTNIGSFEANVQYGLYSDSTYFVKAYVATESYFVYGKVVQFKSKGSTPPLITEFMPTEGTWGDTVVLKGKYFSTFAQNNKVEFGPINSKVLSSTDSTISCVVPNDIPDKTVPIYVTVAGNKSKSSSNFNLISPTIENFSPHMGTFEDVVVITGTDFSSIKEKNLVKFNEHIAEVIEATTSMIKVKVPVETQTKENTISVTVNLQTSVGNVPFNILPPIINSISTDKEFIGATIQISGNNFNPLVTGNLVLFGELSANILSCSKNLMTVQIPEGIYKSRSLKIEVRVAEQSDFSDQVFTLQNAWIRKADVPHGQFGRYAAASFSINGRGYVGLGGAEVGNNFWRYDPEENLWTEIASFPGGIRWGPTSFVIDDKAYVGLGSGSGTPEFKNDLWRYDPVSNTWTKMSDAPRTTEGYAVGLSANGKGYVVTADEMENFWEYDPNADSWVIKADDFPGVSLPYIYPSSGFTINENLYVFSNDNSTGPNPFYAYNSDEWIPKAEVDDPWLSFGSTGFAVGGMGYVRGELFLNKYDVDSNTWQYELEGPPGSRAYSIVFVINDKVYFGCGFYGQFDLWEFDPNYE